MGLIGNACFKGTPGGLKHCSGLPMVNLGDPLNTNAYQKWNSSTMKHGKVNCRSPGAPLNQSQCQLFRKEWSQNFDLPRPAARVPLNTCWSYVMKKGSYGILLLYLVIFSLSRRSSVLGVSVSYNSSPSWYSVAAEALKAASWSFRRWDSTRGSCRNPMLERFLWNNPRTSSAPHSISSIIVLSNII